ncbi:MAG: MarC family protein [Nitrososphaerales archaeon]
MLFQETIYNVSMDALVRATIALFVVVDPIGILPLVASLTSKLKKEESRRLIQVTLYTTSGLLIAFAIAGQQILQVFGISIQSFSIAGGLLLLLLSFDVLLRGWKLEGTEKEMGAVPLAFPLLAGPGAITTLIITLEKSGLIVALLAVGIVLGLTTLVFHSTDAIHRVLGATGSLIVSRVMAIFLAAIAVQFIVEGMQDFLANV